jgi:hypothetical protein
MEFQFLLISFDFTGFDFISFHFPSFHYIWVSLINWFSLSHLYKMFLTWILMLSIVHANRNFSVHVSCLLFHVSFLMSNLSVLISLFSSLCSYFAVLNSYFSVVIFHPSVFILHSRFFIRHSDHIISFCSFQNHIHEKILWMICWYLEINVNKFNSFTSVATICVRFIYNSCSISKHKINR